MGEEKQESLEGKKNQENEEKEIIDVNLVPEFLEKTIEVKSVPGFLNTIIQINNYKDKIINKNLRIRFLKNISEKSNQEKELFYRGSSDDEYKIIPSVFRSEELINSKFKSAIEKEHIMFREMLLQNTENFYNDRTTLDKLVRMQHFGLPTRLLDITSNPLTALFFACEDYDKEKENKKDKDKEKEKTTAEVIVFCVDKCNINYPDSDTVASVSNLVRMSYEERERIKETAKKYEVLYDLLSINLYDEGGLIAKIEQLVDEENSEETIGLTIEKLRRIVYEVEKYIKEKNNENREDFVKIAEELIKRKLNKIIAEKKEKIIEIYDIEDFYNGDKFSVEKEAKEEVKKELTEITKKIYSGDFKNAVNPTECLIELFNSDEDIQKLIHYIKDERPFFEDRILPKDLNRVICVKSKKDNPRIRAQAGDFLLFGKDEALNKEESNYDDVQVLTRIIIKPKYKKAIIEQLDKININKATVYPDMINTSKYIKNKYK